MDGRRFDAFARVVATTSRRRLLAGLAGGLVTLAVGQTVAAKTCTSDAGCPKRKVCGPNGTCLKPTVCDVTEAPTCNPPCSTPQCDAATGTWGCSTCPTGQVCCNGACTINTCATPCTAFDASVCACVSTCPPSLACCDGACIDASFDAQNCGTCGNVCTLGRTCSYGECACPGSLLPCPPDGRCVDTSTDPNNCGACGNVCSDSLYPDCLGGLCGCASETSCNSGGQSSCCTDILPNGNCCCGGVITWPATGLEVCNPCALGDTFCYCNDGIGGWACCANGCAGCTGGGNSGLARCAWLGSGHSGPRRS